MILRYIDKSTWLCLYINIWLIPYPMVRRLYPLGIAGIWNKWWWWWWWWWQWQGWRWRWQCCFCCWWWWWWTLTLSFENPSYVRKKLQVPLNSDTKKTVTQNMIQLILLLTVLGTALSMSHEDQYEHAPLASHCFLAVVSMWSQFQEDATHPVHHISEHLVVHEWR